MHHIFGFMERVDQWVVKMTLISNAGVQKKGAGLIQIARDRQWREWSHRLAGAMRTSPPSLLDLSDNCIGNEGAIKIAQH